jgi:hypothetical protein
MLISRRHRFIFIHIYKNAGTSIAYALKPFALNRWQWKVHLALKKHRIPSWLDPQPLAPHCSAARAIEAMGQTAFNRFFSFAFVRNPWDWQTSLYHFMLKDSTHPQHELIKSLGNFDAYIKWRCANEVSLQKNFIYSPAGELLVDFVGRYENLESDFAKICGRIGISATLPRLNVSNTRPYQSFYTAETRELVSQSYREDIALFGYEF